MSPSLRGRGLKCNTAFGDKMFYAVALFARAWIEITVLTAHVYLGGGRPLCEGVD